MGNGGFHGDLVVRIWYFHCCGPVQSLVEELRSWKPCSVAKKKKGGRIFQLCLKKVLRGIFWISGLITAMKPWLRSWKCVAQYLLGSPQGVHYAGLSWTPCTMYCCPCFVNYITCGLPCHWYLLNPKTRLEGLFRIFGLPFRFLVSYCFGSISPVTAKTVLWYLKPLLMLNGGKE